MHLTFSLKSPAINASVRSLAHLCTLPAELRFQIYEYLLEGWDLILAVEHGLKLRTPLKCGNLLSLMLSCKQVHQEFTPFLYSNHHLYISNPEALLTIARTISLASLQEIRSLSMTWPLSDLPHSSYMNLGYQFGAYDIEAMKAWNVIASMGSLREVTVELNVSYTWRKSWIGLEAVLLECLMEAGGLGGQQHGEEDDHSDEVASKINRETPVEDGMLKERALAIWLPCERDDSFCASSEVPRKDCWKESLGCKIIWK